MRRLMIWFFLFALSVVFTAVMGTQPDGVAAQERAVAVGERLLPLQIIPLQATWAPEGPAAVSTAADECNAATAITLQGNGYGDTTSVDLVQTAPAVTDPVLSCVWGTPGSSQGYRTVWYKFTAPESGQVIVSTANNFNPNRYDTILSVFTGSCGALSLVACNDDYDGLASRVTFLASKNVTYFIEIADWNEAKPGPLVLDLFLVVDPIDSLWENVTLSGPPAGRTRHATVAAGADIYVIGGQDQDDELSRSLFRLETDSKTWVPLAPMPDDALNQLTAAQIDGRIYVPGGSNSRDGDQFVATHKRYDINSNIWLSSGANLPLAIGWSQAVENPNNSGYYLAGGISAGDPFSTTAVVHNDVWFYRIGTNSWESSPPDMAVARYGHTAVWANDGVCVIGGIDDNNTLLPNGECYQPGGSGTWLPTGALNIARYGAGSAVTPDGRWVVFGGTTVNNSGQHVAVPEVEVYDFNDPFPAWEILLVQYDLGGTNNIRERAWPQGEFVGSYLYAVGGNDTTDFFVTTLVQRLFVSSKMVRLPLVLDGTEIDRFDNNFSEAHALALNIPQQDQFGETTDFFEAYRFIVTTSGNVTVFLTDIPSGSNYDLTIYDSNKTFLNEGVQGGSTNEAVTVNLAPGQYYILVERIFGQSDNSHYEIEVRK